MRATATCRDEGAARARVARPLAILIALAVCVAPAGCPDPAIESQIAALGPEDPAVPIGPLHRPDQPCVVCHQEGGNAPPFLFGGTVYFDAEEARPIGAVEVVLLDADGRVHRTATNCAGNFFVRPSEWQPRLPVWATLIAGAHSIDMESPIYREGSCATCHFRPAGPRSAGHVFLSDDPMEPVPLPPSDCPRRP
jgi:hypothetical protein